MAIAQTLPIRINNNPQQVFTATDQAYMIIGGIISNRFSTPASVLIKRDTETLFVAEVTRGEPFQLNSKLVLEQSQNLKAYAIVPPATMTWNSGESNDWTNSFSEDWESPESPETSVILTLSIAGIGV